MESKSILKSKTFWFNILSMAATFLPGVGSVAGPGVAHALPYIVGGVNIGLRLITDGPAHVISAAQN